MHVERRSHSVDLIPNSFADYDWSSYGNHNFEFSRVGDFVRYVSNILKFDLDHVDSVSDPPDGLFTIRLLRSSNILFP